MGSGRRAYKERLEPVQKALKELAKPFAEQDRSRAEGQARSGAAGGARNSERQAHVRNRSVLAKNAEAQIKPAWDEVVAVMPDDVKATRAKLREQLHEIESTAPDPLPAAYAFVNTGEAAPQLLCPAHGRSALRLDPVDPAVPRVVKAGFEIPDGTAGRRTALANWLASRENPLTARVMVNRIWQFRMGDGLVRTPNDFGTMGDKPPVTQPARLAGRGVHGQELERQGNRPADRHFERVPAVVRSGR